MKIILFIVLAIAVLFAGLLIWGYLKGSGVQEDFYEAVLSGEPERLLALMDPDFREKIDAPLLAAWMAHFEQRMGGLKGLSKSNFSTKTSGGVTTSEGTVKFERGEAKSKLVQRDGKLVGFNVLSENLSGVWLEKLPDTPLFRERGKRFLLAGGKGDPTEAWAMMHENLRKQLGDLEKFRAMVEELHDRAGKLVSVEFMEETFTKGAVPEIVIRYDLQWERSRTRARVRLEVAEFRAHLLGFNFLN